MMLLMMITITGTNELRMHFYAASGKIRVLDVSFCCIKKNIFKKMNSFELCNDSKVYSSYAIRRITLWTFTFVRDKL